MQHVSEWIDLQKRVDAYGCVVEQDRGKDLRFYIHLRAGYATVDLGIESNHKFSVQFFKRFLVPLIRKLTLSAQGTQLLFARKIIIPFACERRRKPSM